MRDTGDWNFVTPFLNQRFFCKLFQHCVSFIERNFVLVFRTNCADRYTFDCEECLFVCGPNPDRAFLWHY